MPPLFACCLSAVSLLPRLGCSRRVVPSSLTVVIVLSHMSSLAVVVALLPRSRCGPLRRHRAGASCSLWGTMGYLSTCYIVMRMDDLATQWLAAQYDAFEAALVEWNVAVQLAGGAGNLTAAAVTTRSPRSVRRHAKSRSARLWATVRDWLPEC